MSCALTTGYTLGCRDSVGGIKAIYVQNWISTGSCNANLSGAVTGFTGYNASGFFEYDLTKATSSMTETLNASMENGTIFYTPEVTFTINKMQVAVRQQWLPFLFLPHEDLYRLQRPSNRVQFLSVRNAERLPWRQLPGVRLRLR
jgi:hypothetical protein